MWTNKGLGGAALILGSLLFAAYATLFPLLLPLGVTPLDYLALVRNPWWQPLAATALAGILLMMVGFHAAWQRMEGRAGRWGSVGILFIEAAYLLQACKVTWELCLYPVIAAHPESAFLLRDGVLRQSAEVALFRGAASLVILVGVVSFCIALYRSGEYPKAAPLLIFLGAFTYAIGPVVSTLVAVAGILVLAVGCSIAGLRLLRA